MSSGKNLLLRHTLATIHYRFCKSVRDHHEGFPNLDIGMGVRTPHQILLHILELLRWSRAALLGEKSIPATDPQVFDRDVASVLGIIRELDALLARSELTFSAAARFIQGPFSDILTHVGQLSMFRRYNGDILNSEDYSIAEISVGVLPDLWTT